MVTLLQIPRGSRFEGGAFEDGNLWVDSRGSFHVLCHVYRWGRWLHFIYQPFRNPFSNSVYLNSNRICREDFMYIFNKSEFMDSNY